MPIYPGRRAKTWRVLVYAHGRLHERIVEGRKSDARAVEATLRLELRKAPRVAATRAVPTLRSFSRDVYEPHAKRHLRASTWKLSRKYVVAELIRVLGHVRLDEMRAAEIELFKASRLHAGAIASTINNELTVLKTILRFAKQQGQPVPDLPRPFPFLPKPGKRRARAWSNDEVRRLFVAVEKRWPPLLPLFVWLLNTGCRKGEAIAAEWSWVDWDRAMLTIPVTPYWQPKDKDERMVPLGDTAMALLRSLPRRGRTIFVRDDGQPYKQFPSALSRQAIRAAGVKGTVHTTRHTYASHFLQARPDLRLLAEVLGHSTTLVTERYAHMLPGHLEAARNAVNLAPASPETLAISLAAARR